MLMLVLLCFVHWVHCALSVSSRPPSDYLCYTSVSKTFTYLTELELFWCVFENTIRAKFDQIKVASVQVSPKGHVA